VCDQTRRVPNGNLIYFCSIRRSRDHNPIAERNRIIRRAWAHHCCTVRRGSYKKAVIRNRTSRKNERKKNDRTAIRIFHFPTSRLSCTSDRKCFSTDSRGVSHRRWAKWLSRGKNFWGRSAPTIISEAHEI